MARLKRGEMVYFVDERGRAVCAEFRARIGRNALLRWVEPPPLSYTVSRVVPRRDLYGCHDDAENHARFVRQQMAGVPGVLELAGGSPNE